MFWSKFENYILNFSIVCLFLFLDVQLQKKTSIEIYKHSLLSYIVTYNVALI